MPNWTRLVPLPCETWHTEAVAQQREKLNADIARTLEHRGLHDAYQAKMQSEDVRSLDPGVVFQADCPEHNLFAMLQNELKLREELAAFYPAEASDRRAAYDEACKAHQSAADKLRQGLAKLGYLDTPVPTPGWIQPGYILCHPGVRAAKEYADSLNHPRSDLAQENNAAMTLLVGELDKLRARAVRAS